MLGVAAIDAWHCTVKIQLAQLKWRLYLAIAKAIVDRVFNLLVSLFQLGQSQHFVNTLDYFGLIEI